jgi:hypothetical protein
VKPSDLPAIVNLPKTKTPIIAVLLPAALPDLMWIERLRLADITLIDDLSPFSRKSNVHRGRVRTPNGTQWLYIPVHKDDRHAGIPLFKARVEPSATWQLDFWKALEFNYRNSIWFDHFEFDLRRDLDTAAGMPLYSEATRFLLNRVLGYLEIQKMIPEPQWLSAAVEWSGTKRGNDVHPDGSDFDSAQSRPDYIDSDISTRGGATDGHFKNADFDSTIPDWGANQHEKWLYSTVMTFGEQYFGAGTPFGVVFEPHSRNYQMRGRLADIEIIPSLPHPVYRQHFGGFEPGCCLLDLLFEVGPECWRLFPLSKLKSMSQTQN